MLNIDFNKSPIRVEFAANSTNLLHFVYGNSWDFGKTIITQTNKLHGNVFFKVTKFFLIWKLS